MVRDEEPDGHRDQVGGEEGEVSLGLAIDAEGEELMQHLMAHVHQDGVHTCMECGNH